MRMKCNDCKMPRESIDDLTCPYCAAEPKIELCGWCEGTKIHIYTGEKCTECDTKDE